MKTKLISMSIIIMIALSSGIILFGIQAKAVGPDWPTTWISGDGNQTDPNENSIDDDYKDVKNIFYNKDSEYIYLRMECYAQPGFDIDNDVRYKWFIDTNGSDLLLKGSKVYNAEYLLFIEDSPNPGGDGNVSIYILENDDTYKTGFPTTDDYITSPGPVDNLTADYRLTEENCLDLCIRIEYIDNNSSPMLTWAVDQEDPNVASAPSQDRSDFFWDSSNTLYLITASVGIGGSISPTGDVFVDYGDWKNFTITPDTGYHIDDVLVDGGSVGAVSWYNFTNIDADHTISASFAIDVFKIVASAGSGGSISPTGDVFVDYGDWENFTITPDTGYHIDDVLVDGGSVGAVSWYNFTDVQANHTISASFALNQYTLNIKIVGVGSVSKEPDQINYTCGTNVELTANPGNRYKFSYWSGDLTGTNKTEIINMTGDKFITAHFSASGGGGGGAGGGGVEEFIDEPPTAIISGPYFGTPNEEIQFDATESHDNDEDGQSIIRYDWKFSEDQEWQEELGATPIYIYTQPGVYTVTLKVFDDENNYDANTTTVTIIIPNIPPTIPEINGPDNGIVNISYNYTVVSTDEDGDELKYTIDWGDGISNESEFLPSGESYNVNHKWAVAGNYTVSVTATDGSTVSDKDTTIKINEPPKLKQKGFDYILLLLLLLLFLILLLIILAKRRKDKEEGQKPKGKPKSN